VVLRSPEVPLGRLAHAACAGLDLASSAVTTGYSDVRVLLRYRSSEEWQQFVRAWHAGLSRDLGVVSMGHTLRRAADPRGVVEALVEAAEAALTGDRLFGPGHLTSFADAQIAKFLLAQHDAASLRAFHERALGKLLAEDLKRDNSLLPTLEAYCETLATQRTADRLGVHRNTVLYRVKRIEEVTSADLEDGSTRLLLQVGLLAGRLAHTFARTSTIAAPPALTPHLKVAI